MKILWFNWIPIKGVLDKADKNDLECLRYSIAINSIGLTDR